MIVCRRAPPAAKAPGCRATRRGKGTQKLHPQRQAMIDSHENLGRGRVLPCCRWPRGGCLACAQSVGRPPRLTSLCPPALRSPGPHFTRSPTRMSTIVPPISAPTVNDGLRSTHCAAILDAVPSARAAALIAVGRLREIDGGVFARPRRGC